ncbi:3-beta hydroxysteroid dehydrogenase [Novosphingobium marinum]|uniref:Nucleoside-diphosphate-sugar epimerase n=1 Tax=Novosphingobium marinum TaxID=1514948 RepID=A0A7Y9XT30_9SPHN|nr:NAD-dependent epimerase/dehydratase family protein [Novosphingobium marinum]NYH94049.1 nucleoside-diphosphate-sugar epimerase [Novosphingobium marinum]GGC19195.1 3-beta hydroxysteroid dehydrogenase [Novosphingobium marinum]
MKKVMVFGASGYVGEHIAKHLVRSGYAVSGFARSEKAAQAARAIGAEPVMGDLSDDASIPGLVEGYDAVVWAAQLMLEDEDRVTGVMLDTMAGTDACFIFTSGTSLMSIPTGGDWDERSFAEDEPFTPRRQIAPRLEIEGKVRRAAERGVRGIVVRPPLIWGNGGCRMVEDFYHSARATGAVCHIGRGLNVYSNVHVDDLAELYRLAIEKGRAGALYFAVSGEVSYGVMAMVIANELDVPTRSVSVEEGCEIWDPFMAKIVLPSCSRQRSPRAREELGWAPREDRLDLLEECRNPVYREAKEREVPSWVRKPEKSA